MEHHPDHRDALLHHFATSVWPYDNARTQVPSTSPISPIAGVRTTAGQVNMAPKPAAPPAAPATTSSAKPELAHNAIRDAAPDPARSTIGNRLYAVSTLAAAVSLGVRRVNWFTGQAASVDKASSTSGWAAVSLRVRLRADFVAFGYAPHPTPSRMCPWLH